MSAACENNLESCPMCIVLGKPERVQMCWAYQHALSGPHMFCALKEHDIRGCIGFAADAAHLKCCFEHRPKQVYCPGRKVCWILADLLVSQAGPEEAMPDTVEAVPRLLRRSTAHMTGKSKKQQLACPAWALHVRLSMTECINLCLKRSPEAQCVCLLAKAHSTANKAPGM